MNEPHTRMAINAPATRMNSSGPATHAAEHPYYEIAGVVLLGLAIWGSINLLPDLVRYIRIMRM